MRGTWVVANGLAIWSGDWQLKTIKVSSVWEQGQQQELATWNEQIFVTHVDAHGKGPFKQEHDWNS